MPRIVFTTAYDQYAVKAFDVNALDYLLKPIEPERLATALRTQGGGFVAGFIDDDASLQGRDVMGLRVYRPEALGNLIRDGQSYLEQAWWISTLPGVVILLIAIGLHFLSDGIRQVLDPWVTTGADGKEMINGDIQHMMTVIPIFSRFKNWIYADEKAQAKRGATFWSAIAGVRPEDVTEEELTATEKAFYYEELLPLISTLKELLVLFLMFGRFLFPVI